MTPLRSIGWAALLALPVASASDRAAPELRLRPEDALTAVMLTAPEIPEGGVLLIGEDHRSAWAPRLARRMLTHRYVDCLLVELSIEHQPEIDAYVEHGPWEPLKRMPTWGSDERKLLKRARGELVQIWAVDELTDEMLALTPDQYRTSPEARRLILTVRNQRMAAHAAWLAETGTCSRSVMVVGSGHVLPSPKSAPHGTLQGELEALGVPWEAVVVRDWSASEGVEMHRAVLGLDEADGVLVVELVW